MNALTMNRIALLAALGALALTACAVDLPIAGDDGYSCTTDDDCVAGFICSNLDQPEGSIGRCVDETAVGPGSCRDEDNDGAFVGADCPPGRPTDCDDTDNAVGPNAVEVCDGIDNDCDCNRDNGDTNDDGVICGPGDDNVDEELPPRPCPLQIGLCAGAQTSCIDGAYQDCAAENLYGPDFEPTEQSCDGINNDCDNETDESCDCIPGVDEAFECGSDTGACTRGVQLCQGDGSLSSCVSADIGRVCTDGSSCVSDADCEDGSDCELELCETGDDCAEGGVCVEEWLDHRESFYDDCNPETDTNCRRSVCRYTAPDIVCEEDEECGEGRVCVDGACHARVVPATEEVCNGIDDNCDGSIDDDYRRFDVCGSCPFNMQRIDVTTQSGGSAFACVDWYEASRPDATESDAGEIELYSVSMPNVIPWTGLSSEQAEDACRASELFELATWRSPVAARTLCRTFQWRQACGGKSGTVAEVNYPYSPDRNNDVFIAGACTDGSLGFSGPQPTGSSEECCLNNICDTVGNVAEYVVGADNLPDVAGGGYSDTDESILSCGDGVSYEPVPADAEDRDDIGFRCCTAVRN